MAIKKELDLSLNNFKEQKTYSGAIGKAKDIQNLLFMKPGDFPSVPDMGINISSIRYKDIDSLTSGDLREKIRSQINKYITAVPLENIVISKAKINNTYVLFIDITLYADNQALDLTYGIQQQGENNIVNFQLNITENKIGRSSK